MKKNKGNEMNRISIITSNFGDFHSTISKGKNNSQLFENHIPSWKMIFDLATKGLLLIIFEKPFNWDNTDKNKILNDVFSKGKIAKINQKFIEQYRSTENDIIGLSLNEFFNNVPEKIKEILYSLFEKGQVHEKLKQKRIDSSIFYTENTFTCLTDNNDLIWGCLCFQEEINSDKENIQEYENYQLKSLLNILNEKDPNEQGSFERALNEAIKLTKSKTGFVLLYDEASLSYKLNCCSDEFMKYFNISEKVKDFVIWLKDIFGFEKPFIINDLFDLNIQNRSKCLSDINKFMVIPVTSDNGIAVLTILTNKSENYNDTDINLITLLMGIAWKNIERKKFQEKLFEAKKKVEDSEMLKTAFLSNLSHEIRTPMNGIVGFSTLLNNHNISNGKRIQYTEIINQSCNKLLDVIDKLLDIAKIEANQIKVNLNEINLNSLLEEVYTSFDQAAKNKALEFIIETNLPDNNINIITDSNKLIKIIKHLLSNAIKFTQNGYVKLICRFDLLKIEFEVKDTGIGIAPENQHVIFERFRQLDNSPKREFGGCGLGLTISKEYVKLLGGELNIHSQLGKGTTFLFELPVKYNKIISEHFLSINDSN